jgi:hypothetical protein
LEINVDTIELYQSETISFVAATPLLSLYMQLCRKNVFLCGKAACTEAVAAQPQRKRIWFHFDTTLSQAEISPKKILMCVDTTLSENSGKFTFRKA